MTEHWFRPNTHGYGAYPISSKGWALIVVFGAAQMALAVVTLFPPAASGGAADLTRLAAFGLGTAVLTAGFIWICKLKTDGDWHWRWTVREK